MLLGYVERVDKEKKIKKTQNKHKWEELLLASDRDMQRINQPYIFVFTI